MNAGAQARPAAASAELPLEKWVGARSEAVTLFIGGAWWLMAYPGNAVAPELDITGPAGWLLLRGTAPLWWWKSAGMLLLLLGWLTAYRRAGGRQWRAGLILLFALWTVVLPLAGEITLRHLTQPQYYAHDGGVLQIEAAIGFLAAGVNPYTADYRATPLGKFSGMAVPGEHPALAHLVYPPAAFLLPAPFVAGCALAGLPGDVRLVYLAVFLLVAVVLAREATLLPLIGWVANPLLNFYLVRGTNDHLMLALILFGLLAARTGRWRWAGALLGLAGLVKFFAWAVALFLFAGQRDRAAQRAGAGAWLAVTAGLLLPFALWSPRALYDDLLAYPLGFAADSYPLELIGNYGSGALHSALSPAGITLLAAGGLLATLVLLALLLRRHSTGGGSGDALLHAALLLAVAGWCGRFLHDNYLGIFALLAWWGLTLPERCATLPDGVNLKNEGQP